MPPQLALFLCVCFVLFLLRLDRKQDPEASFTLWLPTIWMLYCATRALGSWFQPDATGDVADGSSLDRNFLIILILLGFGILLSRKFDWQRWAKTNPWLVLLLVYMGMSVVWSDHSFISFKRYVREWGTVLMALIVVTEPRPREAMETLFRRSVYVLTPFSIVLVKYFPHWGMAFDRWDGMKMWVGVTDQKNGLGRLCMFSAFYFLWMFIRRWQRREQSVKYETVSFSILLLMTLWLFKGPGHGAYSASSICAFCVGFGTFLWLLWINRTERYGALWLLYPALFAFVILGSALPLVGGSSFSELTSALGRNATFTGRTEIWHDLLPVVKQHPILGVGYGGFWLGQLVGGHWNVNEAHNGYLGASIELGLIGLSILVLLFFAYLRQALRVLTERDFYSGAFAIGFLMMLVIHNFMEASFIRNTAHLWAIFVFLQITEACLLWGPAPAAESVEAPDFAASMESGQGYVDV